MGEHYFTSQPSSKKEVEKVYVQLRGHSFTFLTGSGVFSRKGVDFGSRLLVETFERGDAHSVLDLGCGYGAIGVSLAVLYPQIDVTMVDVNERAVELTQLNLNKYRVEERAHVRVSDGFSKVTETFDVIVCNPPIRAGKQVIESWFMKAKDHLRDAGALWIVIRKQQGAASAQTKLQEIFPVVEVVKQKKGYRVLRAMNQQRA